ncbi:hypothetical protein AVEN_189117-1, partial [Araneus ventricosus]
CARTSNPSGLGIEPAFIELEGSLYNHYTGRGYTRWDRWFIKIFPKSILPEWFPKRFARKYFRGQLMESIMATFFTIWVSGGRASCLAQSSSTATNMCRLLWTLATDCHVGVTPALVQIGITRKSAPAMSSHVR